jgi:prepilin-type N-terminal cleavage/methylation domain-containing protein
MRDERGFTLIEVLTAVALTAILVTLAAGGLRHYWLNQSLVSARGQVVSQLRQMQEQVVSETHPTVFGARFRVGSSDWGVVEYDPTITASHPATTCKEVRSNTFSTGVKVTAASFATPTDTAMANLCKTIPGASSDKFAFFYARGSATGGTITLTQPAINKTKTITVTPITGRVEGN